MRDYSEYLDEFGYAASIGAAHAVHLVHDHNTLPTLAHLVKSHTVEFDVQNAVFIASVTGVELHEVETKLFTNEFSRGCLTDSWLSTD